MQAPAEAKTKPPIEFSHQYTSSGHRVGEKIDWSKMNRTGLVFGTVLAGFHVIWALLVMAGWAQPLINFVFWAHMIQPIYVIKAFDPLAALTLIAITFTSGYACGFIGAFLWNKLHPKP